MAITQDELVKLTIKPEDNSSFKSFEVLFNPNSYSISKSVNWSAPDPSGQGTNKKAGPTKAEVNAPPTQFGGGGSRQLSLELFYDVTENQRINDVRDETKKIVVLAFIDRKLGLKKPRPPWCEIQWGDEPLCPDFKGVITNLTQKFTLFSSNGNPVRANLSVTFTEYLDPKDDKRKTDPELTTRVWKRGDTLSNISGEVYGNPNYWREIAEANNLDDPLKNEVGRTLSIPELS